MRDLLRGQRLLSLAVVVGGRPVAGLLPYVAAPDLKSVVVHASRLARHTAGLGDGAPWGGGIAEPDAPDRDPLQTRRVLLEGHSRSIEDDAVLSVLTNVWRGRYPSAEMTLQLPDFTFFSLDIAAGRLVTGFARALNLSVEHFAQAATIE